MSSSYFSTQRTAATFGVYVAAVVPVICGLIATPISAFSIPTLLFLTALTYGLSLALGGLFGLPIFMLMIRLRLVRWWATLVGGLIIGVLIAVLIRLPHIPELRSLAYFGVEGAISGLVFWVFWILGPEPTVANARAWVHGRTEQFDGL